MNAKLKLNPELAKVWSATATDDALLRSVIDAFNQVIFCGSDEDEAQKFAKLGLIFKDEILRRMGGYRNN